MKDKIVTERELVNMRKRGIKDEDFGVLFSAFFARFDGHVDTSEEKINVLTIERSPLFKNRKHLEKKFKIKIITAELLNNLNL